MSEHWKSIPGWEDYYEVSNLGRVRSKDRTIRVKNPVGVIAPRRFRGRVLRPSVLKKGYEMVSFTAPGRKRAYRYVHDLVLAAFVGPKPTGQEVCHGDGVKRNNRLSNLRYDTQSSNVRDRKRHGQWPYVRSA